MKLAGSRWFSQVSGEPFLFLDDHVIQVFTWVDQILLQQQWDGFLFVLLKIPMLNENREKKFNPFLGGILNDAT